MKKIIRLICILTVLCSVIVCYGIYAAEDTTKVSIQYVGLKDYADENSYDISITSKCYIGFEDGTLNVFAGKEGQNGTVNAVRIDLDIPYTNVRVKRYPYLAIKIKTDAPETGGVATCYAGDEDQVAMEVSFDYADTTDWQTVVIDFSKYLDKVSSGTISYRDSLKLLPFGENAKVEYGTKVSIDSFAFFMNENTAAGFTGNLEDYEAAYAAQSGEWLSAEFVDPSADYKMQKLLYNFTAGYESTIEKLYKGYGYGGVTTNVTFNQKYLNDIKEFDLLDSAFAHALETGMTQVWIYDEYQWPSGTAYGQVAENNPEYLPEGVAQIVVEGTGNDQYALGSEYTAIVRADLEQNGSKTSLFFENNTVSVTASGDWKLYVYATYRMAGTGWDGKDYVNIMDKEALGKFIELTHDKYKQYLDESFSSVGAFFTDEPSLGTTSIWGTEKEIKLMPWEDGFTEKFQEMHGYSVLDNMSSLFTGNTEWDKVVRVNFYQTVASMVAEAYFKQIEDWCSANGVASSGHPLLEEMLTYHVAIYGDLMACLNEMGIPGCDLLIASPDHIMAEGSNIGTYQAMKFASSATRNNNREGTFVEFNPEAGIVEQFTSDPFGSSIGTATLTLLFGTDRLVMLNPQESYNAWQARQLNDYVGRINTIIDGAVMNSGIAVYYPITSAQAMLSATTMREGDVYNFDVAFNTFCKSLIERGLDYNYLDESTIMKATLKDGKLICGQTEYAVIVMPFVESMSSKTMTKLAEFESQGGQIIWVNNLPEFATDYSNTDKLMSMIEKYKDSVLKYEKTEEALDAIADKVKSCVKMCYTVESDNEGVYYSPLERDGKQIVFIANKQSSKATVTVSFGEGKSFSVYDPYTGVITKYTGETELACMGYRGLLVVGEYIAPEFVDPAAVDSDSNTLIIVIAIVAGVLIVCGIVAFIIIKKSKKAKA